MIEEKETLTGNIESTQSIEGKVNVSEVVIPPTLQEKEVTPTTSVQNVTYDENYNGLSKVVVNAIPNEYIIPSGELDITTNGTYNVTQYASAKVTTNEADLNWSSIGYSATPDFIKTYYDYAVTIKNNFTPAEDIRQKYANDKKLVIMPLVDISTAKITMSLFNNCSNLKCVPKFIAENLTNLNYMFAGCTSLTKLDLSGFKTGNVNQCVYMFQNDTNLVEVDLSSFTTKQDAQSFNMFTSCISLMKIDMRNYDFTKLSSYNNMFGSASYNGVPDNCLIIVKDATQKAWVNEKFARLTNVKTVAEYEQS